MSNAYLQVSLSADGGSDSGSSDGSSDRSSDSDDKLNNLACTVERCQIQVVQESSNTNFLKHTEDQISDLRQQTYDTAFEQGLAEGFKQGEQQSQQQFQQLQALIQAIAEPLKHMDDEVYSAIASLIADIVSAITLTSLQQSPELICQIVNQAVALLDESEQPVIVYLHSDDAVLLEAFMHEASDGKNWRLHSSNQMQRGDVNVQCEHQFIKESLQQRIARITEHVLKADTDEDSDDKELHENNGNNDGSNT